MSVVPENIPPDPARISEPSEAIDVDAPVRPGPQWDVTAVVAVGGVLGAEARYGLALTVPHPAAAFAWSTVLINVVGCFLLGSLMTVLARRPDPPRLLRPFLGIGVLGGFTTFSTFTVDAVRLAHDHRVATAGLYLLATVGLAASAVLAGSVVTGWVGDRRRNTLAGSGRGAS